MARPSQTFCRCLCNNQIEEMDDYDDGYDDMSDDDVEMRPGMNSRASKYKDDESFNSVYYEEVPWFVKDYFQGREIRNASRLHSESRDAMFKRAMTLLSARCTSTGPNGNLSNKKVEAQFGVNSKGRVIGQQFPQYFFIDQKKPTPMPPLKAWNGFNGNVYFEPLRIQAVTDTEQSEALVPMNDNQNRLLASRKRTSSDRLKRPDSSTTQSSKYTARSTKSSGPVVLLDHKTVINRFNDLKDDLALLDGQETTGSLSVRPKSDVTMDRNRRKEMMYNKERICKGSVVHKLSPNDLKKRPKVPLKVNGGRFVPHDQMSPLLRTQTQYSLSNQRLTTNSPDPYHQALPPLEQLRATVRHMDTAETANKAGYRYNKSVTITEEIKPFVKYSPAIKRKEPTGYA